MCECGKAYLSAPALTNHKKTKHNSNDPSLKRGRGRPRKNVRKLIIKAYSQLSNDRELRTKIQKFLRE
jgi:hypothetical protein